MDGIAPVVDFDLDWYCQAFDDIYEAIRSWVSEFFSQPSGAAMSLGYIRSTPIWQYFVAAYRPLSESQASAYVQVHFQDSNSRQCLLSRVIVDYLVYRIWTHGAWVGFSESTTSTIKEIDGNLNRNISEQKTLSLNTIHLLIPTPNSILPI